MGCPVTVIEPLPALMIRGLGPALSQAMTRRHLLAGTDLRLGVGVAAVEPGAPHSPGVTVGQVVRLTDGTAVPANLVVVAAGAAPETGWLCGSGLDLSDGVLCDGQLAAVGVPGVYAAGDVARWHHPRYANPVRMEHWTSAIEHAGVVAANICGQGGLTTPCRTCGPTSSAAASRSSAGCSRTTTCTTSRVTRPRTRSSRSPAAKTG